MVLAQGQKYRPEEKNGNSETDHLSLDLWWCSGKRCSLQSMVPEGVGNSCEWEVNFYPSFVLLTKLIPVGF